MKKFQFSLDGVLSYKQQILDALQGEHGILAAQVRDQESRLETLWQAYYACGEEYRKKSQAGMAIIDARLFQSRLRAMERELQQETAVLEQLRKKEEEKRAEVVEAKKESTSIEKLKDKKLEAYHKEEAKSEERFIEDFVNMTRLAGSAGI